MSAGLNMKFGENGDNAAHGFDFSHLENNPNYKPEGDEPNGDEEIIDPPAGDEPNGDEPQGDEPSGDDKPEGDEPNGDEPAGDEPAGQSSLNTDNDDAPAGDTPLEVTEEMLFKTLSEKLGKTITSLDDLAPEPIEIDPQVKAINDWKQKTGRPIEDFFKFQKDFSKVNDIDIAREFLQIEYPTLTPEEVNLELEQFIAADEDLESDVARKNLNLKKYATKGRDVLEKLKGDLGEPVSNSMTPEIQSQLDYAKKVQEQIQTNQKQQAEYFKGITDSAISTESMTLQLSDDLSIDFKVSEEDRKAIPSFINEMPHWRNEDGSWNHKAVVEDSIKIKYFDTILKIAHEQGINSGKEIVIKQTKNVNLDDKNSAAGQQGEGQKRPVYETSVDKLLGKQGMTMKFGN